MSSLLGPSSLFQVADQFVDRLPQSRIGVSEPETPEYRQEIVNLPSENMSEPEPEISRSYLLNILVTVEDQHVPSMGHQRTFWLMLVNTGTYLDKM